MTPQIADKSRRSRGRPRSFDPAEAMGKAMKLFWEHGYEGTSFDDLIGAMGISASSFYISFGSKEKLYRDAIETFIQDSEAWFFSVLNDETLGTRAAFERLLEAVAAQFTRPGMPSGCMLSLAGAHVSMGLSGLRETMTEHRVASERSFASRLRSGIEKGDVPADIDVDVLAAYFSSIVRGLAVQARDGATRERLMQIIGVALRVWP